MKPKYKIGDKVLVKSKYDPGCNEYDYRTAFTLPMIKLYGGKVCIIKHIENANIPPRKVPDDGYIYRLENIHYYFTSGMFIEEF